MRKAVVALALLGAVALALPSYAEDQLVKLTECQAVTPEALHEFALTALTNRRYKIEENTPALLVGELEGKKVEIVIEPSSVVIRWKQGFEGKKDYWLRNLKTDVLWRLAE